MHCDQQIERVADTVIGMFFDVYNELRYGFLEQVYVGALAVELRRKGIPFSREHRIDVHFRGERIGFYRADLLVDSRLVVEVKAGKSFDESARWQTLNYLRATNLPLGLVLHFGSEARFHRVVGPAHRLCRPRPRPRDEGCS